MSRTRLRFPRAAVTGLVAGLALLAPSVAWIAQAQAPPPPSTRKKPPTPTPKPGKGGGGGGGGGGGSTSPARATLLIDSDMNCTVTIDGEQSYKVTANKPMKIDVSAGEHLLKAVSEDGRRRLEQVVKGGGGGNTVVPIKLLTAAASTAPEDFDKQGAKVFTALTDLKVMGEFIGGLWKKSFFFHDRGITEAFHTSKQVLVRETDEFKKFSPADAKRQRVFDELNRLSPDGQKYVDLITQAVTAAQSNNSTIGDPTNLFGQAQAIVATLNVSPDVIAILKESPAFRDALPPDLRTRAGLPNDNRDVHLGADYASSFPNMLAVVDKGGAADAMGFKSGDRILSVNGRDVASIWDFKLALRAAGGGKLTVVFERDGKQQRKDIKGLTG